MERPDALDEATSLVADAASPTAMALSALMARHGVGHRHQAAQIAQICAISISQARRKLRGAVWLFDEVLVVCQHFGASLDSVFPPGSAPRGGPDGAPLPQALSHPAWLLADDQRMACDIHFGPLEPEGTAPSPLQAVYGPEGWLVATPTRLTLNGVVAPRYGVDHLQFSAPSAPGRARIAVVDDDAGSAEALSDWFNESGYHAQAFTSPAQLLASPLDAHDAYVVDLILAGGQTSQALVERIRLAQPQAPIVLLTGQLRGGQASEATLATLLRTQGVTFFEKPVRPAVLTAAIQSSLDRLSAQAPHA
jgi:CheY-like chemotaxis protein